MAASLGSLVVSLSANTADFVSAMDKSAYASDKAMRKMKADAEKIGAALGAMSAVAVGALAYLVVRSIDAADHLNDLNKTTGISVEQLAGLGLAAKQSGTDLDGVASSISKFSQNIGKDSEKFRALGITAKEPLEAFKQLADIFTAVEDPQTRAALGAAALGKSWQSAAPLLAEGGKNIGEMVEKGTRLSGMTKSMAEEADKLNDQLAELKAVSDGLGTKMAAEMVGPFNDIIKAIKEAYTESGKLMALWVAMGAVGAFLFTDEFASAKTKINDLSAELDKLEKEQARRKAAQARGMVDWVLFGDSSAELVKKIADAKSKIAGLQDSLKPPKPAQQKAPPTPDLAAKVAEFINEPKPLKPSGVKAKGKDPDADFRAYLDNLDKQIQKTDELTAVEKVLAEVQAGRLTLSGKQQPQLLALAAIIDKEKEAVTTLQIRRDVAMAAGDAVTKANEEYQKLLAGLTDNTPSRVLEKQRADMEFLTAALQEGVITEQLYLEAVTTRLDLTAQKSDDASSAAQKLGMTFSSAFEEAIAGGKSASEIINALADDVLKMLVRMQITEPLAKSLAGMFSGGGGGGGGTNWLGIIGGAILGGASSGGGAAGANYSLAGSSSGSALSGFKFAEGTDFVPRDMVAEIHKGERIIPAAQNRRGMGGINITSAPSITIDSRTDQAQIRALVAGAVRQGNAQLIDDLQTAGAL